MSASSHATRLAATNRLRPLLRRPAVTALAALPARFDAHLVGGVLRDGLLGRRFVDLDAVVAGDGEEAAERLATSLGASWFRIGGNRFAAFRLEGAGRRVDLWGRGSTSVEADLERRDFTVNSIALRLGDFTLRDPFGGLVDLERRRLHATSAASFSEDPLRSLRLVRFAVALRGFSADAATLELARRAAPDLASVARERVREELSAVFSIDAAAAALELLERVDLYPRLWQAEAAPAPLARLRRLSRRAADLAALPAPRRVDLFAASQAVIFDELPGGSECLVKARDRGLLAGRDARTLSRLLEWDELPRTAPDCRWLLHRSGELWPTLAAVLGSAAAPAAWSEALAALDRLATEEAEEIFTPPPLLDGHQIASLLGLEPGPRLGELVAALRRAQIEGRIDSAEAAARFLRDLVED